MADDNSNKGLRGRDLASLGGLLAGAVVAGLVVGLLLDSRFDSAPVCTLLGLFLGVLAGAVGFWIRVRAALRD